MPTANKLGTVATYKKELSNIKSYDPSITWSCEVTRETEYVLSPFSPKSTKPSKVVADREGLSPIKP